MEKQKPKYNEYGMTQWYWIVRHRENFEIGENTQIGAFTSIDALGKVEIQDNVKIGFGATILSYSSIDNKKGKVVIKKNSSIGANSTIMPGVTIGENSIVGANSFVNKSIPDNEIWLGNPVRFYKGI